MKNLTQYIHFDQDKLDAIGFNNKTICELIEIFLDYLLITEGECNTLIESVSSEKELIELLHKIEGAMQYLSLAGPISYIGYIRVSLKINPVLNQDNLLKSLIYISRETIKQLQTHYQKVS